MWDLGPVWFLATLKFGCHGLVGMCLVFVTLWLVIFYSQCGLFVIELLLLPTFTKVWLHISLPHFLWLPHFYS
jgi:hypothetical protein